MNALKSYSWPGNIRELQNVIERAVILSDGGLLPNPLRPTHSGSVVAFPSCTTLKESERALILGALEATGWLVGGPYGAAGRLGMKRTTLIARMKKHGILRPAEESSLNQSVPDDSRSTEHLSTLEDHGCTSVYLWSRLEEAGMYMVSVRCTLVCGSALHGGGIARTRANISFRKDWRAEETRMTYAQAMPWLSNWHLQGS